MSSRLESTTRADSSALMFALVFPSVLTLVYFSLLAEASAATQLVAYGSLKTIQFGFPICWYLFVQRQPLRLGLPRAAGLGPGILFGAVVLVAMWALYRLVLSPSGLMDAAREPVADKIAGLGAETFISYMAIAVFYSVAHSFLEEYYWRWFVFAQLSRVTTLPLAITVSSLGFMAHHVIVVGTFFGWASPLGWSLALCVAIGGAVWAWMYHRWGSLYPVWVGHLLVDAGIFWVGYDLIGGFS